MAATGSAQVEFLKYVRALKSKADGEAEAMLDEYLAIAFRIAEYDDYLLDFDRIEGLSLKSRVIKVMRGERARGEDGFRLMMREYIEAHPGPDLDWDARVGVYCWALLSRYIEDCRNHETCDLSELRGSLYARLSDKLGKKEMNNLISLFRAAFLRIESGDLIERRMTEQVLRTVLERDGYVFSLLLQCPELNDEEWIRDWEIRHSEDIAGD